MKYECAKKLHNGDEVTIRETKEITTVINTEVNEKDVVVYAMSSEYGYHGFNHKEIS